MCGRKKNGLQCYELGAALAIENTIKVINFFFGLSHVAKDFTEMGLRNKWVTIMGREGFLGTYGLSNFCVD